MKFFNNLTSLQKSLVISILSIVLFIGSTSASYSFFSSQSSQGEEEGALPSARQNNVEDPSEPRTEECPLNGNLHTKKAKEAWEGRRPAAVMVENSTDARPQSGLSSADVVYEAVAEGGITRFMAVFLCNLADTQVGPVRSARTYFLDWVSEYDGLYAHVGGANTPGPANALGQIIKYEIKSLNQFGIGFPTYWRDYERLQNVATEHTMYTTTYKLWEAGNKRSWGVKDSEGEDWQDNFTKWQFKQTGAAQGTAAAKITVPFWKNHPDYTVTWNYDKDCNCYKRSHGDNAHNDLNNNQQLSVKNVVVQFQKESRANDGYENNLHMIYGTIGSGKALIFQDGVVIEGKWNKKTRTSKSQYVDNKGNEIKFNGGLIWIQTVPEGAEVEY